MKKSQDLLLIVTATLLLFFAISVGYLAHRLDLVDARLTNLESAKDN